MYVKHICVDYHVFQEETIISDRYNMDPLDSNLEEKPMQEVVFC